MKTKALFCVVTVTVILICFSSCITYKTIKAYDGHKKDKASLSIVQGVDCPHPKIGEFTKIIRIDNTPFERKAPAYDGKYRFMTLPGAHSFDIIHYQTNRRVLWFLGWYIVTFDAEAGKAYIIHADTNPETSVVDVYVTDADSGERITSIVDYKYKFKEKE